MNDPLKDGITLKYDVSNTIADICKQFNFEPQSEMETMFQCCRMITNFLKKNNKYCPELGDRISYVCFNGKIECFLYKRPMIDFVEIDFIVEEERNGQS